MIQDRSKGVLVAAVSVLALLCGALGLSGCDGGDSSSTSGGGTTTATPCPPGELTLADGTCQPAGLPPDMPCPPGELLLDDGMCQKAGVPASACGAGFMPDGKDGCEPILPADPCPPGQMAVPGDTQCHEVAPCGSGTWGDIPVEANTQFVDKSYAGGNSDGSKEKPWTKIHDGIIAAAKGAIVAVAAGSYSEDLKITSKPVRLWGRCPAMVEVAGTGANVATIGVYKIGAGSAEIHGLAVTGAQVGIQVSGAGGAGIDAVWIHDAGNTGVDIQNGYGPTSVVIKGSLVEHNKHVGVFVVGSEATIESTAVRSTLPDAQGTDGRGIDIQDDTPTKAQANVTVRGCLVEQNYRNGVVVVGSKATMEATVVRSTLLDAQGGHGYGIDVEEDPKAGLRGDLTVRACLLEQNHTAGAIILGSDATIEATVVRSTQPRAVGLAGFGIHIAGEPGTMDRANVTVHACLIEQNHEVGVGVLGADVTIEATVVRSTSSDAMGNGGRGISIENDTDAKQRTKATIRACVVEQNREVGVFVGGSDATIETTTVRSTMPNGDGQGGRGINIEHVPAASARAMATIHACAVEQNHEIGVFVLGSDATIEASIVRDTAVMGDNKTGGDGIAVASGTATIQSVAVTHNARAGISSFGGQVLVTGAVLTCNGFDLDGEPALDGTPFSFDGSTGWQCSRKAPAACTELGDCSVETSNLQAPQPVSPVGGSPKP